MPRRRGPATDVLVLCYHGVSESWPSDLAVTPGQFERQLAGLRDAGYEGATFTQAVHDPPSDRTVAVTFDDGFRSVLTKAAPILDRLALPATVFVPTGFVGVEKPMRWPGVDQWAGTPHEGELVPMSWEELGTLRSKGWEIGSHGRTHPRLTQLSDEDLAAELESSRQQCRTAGHECLAIAYPFGDVDERVVTAAQRAGYSGGAALPHPLLEAESPLRWPRIGVYRSEDDRRFRRKTSPLMRRLRRMRAWRLVQARHRVRR